MLTESDRFRAFAVWMYDLIGRIGAAIRLPTVAVSRLLAFRGPYGYLNKTVRRHEARLSGLDDDLNRAAYGVPWDVYVTRITLYSILVAVLGLFVGLFLSVALATSGILGAVTLPCPAPGSVCGAVSANKLPLQTATISLVSAVLLGTITWSALYYRPRVRAGIRRRSIELNLPGAVVFMYALSHGGMSIIEVMRQLGDADDAYGEVAEEFDHIVRDVDMFGATLNEAMLRAQRTTPSRNFRRFLDDLMNVIESGGDVTQFLRDRSHRSLEEARREQEDYVATLGLLGEVYATMFIAGPLLLLIILLVISFVGGQTIGMVFAVIYIGIPVGIVGYSLLLDLLAGQFHLGTAELGLDEGDDAPEPPTKDPRFHEFRRTTVVRGLLDAIHHPLRPFYHRPVLTGVVTVPAAVAIAVLFHADGVTLSSVATTPVRSTTKLVVLPTLVVVTPMALFHEWKQRDRRSVTRRFPDKLMSISNANEMGLPLPDAIDYVSNRESGRLDRELRLAKNDLDWNNDVAGALTRLANRLRTPQISRTSKLLGVAAKTTGDLNKVLNVAAEETRNMYLLERDRAREMSGYVAVILVSFLVYLGVVVMLDAYYLAPLAAAISNEAGDVAGPVVTVLNAEQYRMVFYHSVLIQAFGNGLLAGKMGDGTLYSGLKYAIVFLLIAIVVFYGIVI